MTSKFFVGGPYNCEWREVRKVIHTLRFAEIPGIDFSPHPPKEADMRYSLRKHHTYELHAEGFYIYKGLE